jgi:hypothetical protein
MCRAVPCCARAPGLSPAPLDRLALFPARSPQTADGTSNGGSSCQDDPGQQGPPPSRNAAPPSGAAAECRGEGSGSYPPVNGSSLQGSARLCAGGSDAGGSDAGGEALPACRRL